MKLACVSEEKHTRRVEGYRTGYKAGGANKCGLAHTLPTAADHATQVRVQARAQLVESLVARTRRNLYSRHFLALRSQVLHDASAGADVGAARRVSRCPNPSQFYQDVVFLYGYSFCRGFVLRGASLHHRQHFFFPLCGRRFCYYCPTRRDGLATTALFWYTRSGRNPCKRRCGAGAGRHGVPPVLCAFGGVTECTSPNLGVDIGSGGCISASTIPGVANVLTDGTSQTRNYY